MALCHLYSLGQFHSFWHQSLTTKKQNYSLFTIHQFGISHSSNQNKTIRQFGISCSSMAAFKTKAFFIQWLSFSDFSLYRLLLLWQVTRHVKNNSGTCNCKIPPGVFKSAIGVWGHRLHPDSEQDIDGHTTWQINGATNSTGYSSTKPEIYLTYQLHIEEMLFSLYAYITSLGRKRFTDVACR